jgi:hypothetical protein
MINDQIPEVMKSRVKVGGEEREEGIEIGNMWWASVSMMKRGTQTKTISEFGGYVCTYLYIYYVN